MPAPREQPLREYLRAGTSDLHAALDAQVASRQFLRSRDGYREFLLRTLVFHAGAEHALDTLGAQAWIPDWPQRRRTSLLIDDLHVLAPDEPGVERTVLASAEVSHALASPASRERVFGIAYVLEGSTLGAAYVLRELKPLGVTATQGASFLAGGRSPERRWPGFLARLEAQDTGGFDRAAALDAARATFSAAHQHLG